MDYPKKLVAGAYVGVVAVSSQISMKRVEECKKVLEDLGFRVKLADNLACSKGGYMAGDEKLRAQLLCKMFSDDQIEAIFCVRGGDGANRILNYIDLDIIRQNKKIFVGYSDVTSLHILFNQQCGLVTFHGPMVSSNMVDHFDKETKISLFEGLTAMNLYAYKPPTGFDIEVAKKGKAEGPLTGGNLTVMCASLGTPYEMDTKGKILFIEEVGEHIGNIDRHIFQLSNAGKLEQAAGILLGQFTRCEMETEDYGIKEILLDATKNLNIPIMYNIQSGHDFPMITLPMGARCRMDTQTKTIEFLIEHHL